MTAGQPVSAPPPAEAGIHIHVGSDCLLAERGARVGQEGISTNLWKRERGQQHNVVQCMGLAEDGSSALVCSGMAHMLS